MVKASEAQSGETVGEMNNKLPWAALCSLLLLQPQCSSPVKQAYGVLPLICLYATLLANLIV